jgi:4-amino-4-deoxy-L-arabinose transferase-like glycosyltransferase
MALWLTLAALAVLTIVLRLPAFLSSRHLVYDDGTYGVSVLDMRHGLAPYRGVFSAQGPLHFPLLYAGDLLGFRTLDGPRVAPLLAGVLATIASWAVARRIAGANAGLIAGALVATSGSMIWTTGQVTGDGVASAIAVAAVWAAVAYRDDPRLARAVLTGIVIGAALAVKPLVATAALPVGWWLWSRRRLDHLAAAVGAAVVVWFAAALPWGLSRVWEQSVDYNRGAGPRFSKISQLRKLATNLSSRDLLVVGALVLALLTVAAAAGWFGRRVADRTAAGLAARADVILIAVWAAVTALVLVLEPALYRNHLATVVPPLAVLAAILVRAPRVLAVVLVLLIPFSVANLNDILWPTGYRGAAAELMHELDALPRDAWVISDEPGFVYRAGLRTPPLLNDPSMKRIDQGSLTTDVVADAAADPRVCAVIAWSPRFGRELPGLADRLTAEGLEPRSFGNNRTLWLRPDCDP